MSQKTVQSIIGRLVTDEEYRFRFLDDPLGTLNELRDQGVELTRERSKRSQELTALSGPMRQSASTDGCSGRVSGVTNTTLSQSVAGRIGGRARSEADAMRSTPNAVCAAGNRARRSTRADFRDCDAAVRQTGRPAHLPRRWHVSHTRIP